MSTPGAIQARPFPTWVRLAAAPLVLIGLLAGLWFFAGVLAPGYNASIAFAVGWFVVAAIGLGAARKRWPPLALPLRITYLATAVVVGGWFALTTFTDKTVDEQIVSGAAASQQQGVGNGNVELAHGTFEGVAHGASGTAAIVDIAGGGRKLTFTDLSTTNGPDLRVYLVAGPASGDGDVDDFVDLGGLKGNKGTQQYEVPAGTDIDRYATVVIWCRAFTVSFARAPLQTS